MELENFVSRNFKPRDDVEQKAKELIEQELKTVSANGKLKAVIADQGDSFKISMVAQADKKIFSSESHHLKSRMIGAPRAWQLDAVRLVLQDLIRQIKKHLKLPE